MSSRSSSVTSASRSMRGDLLLLVRDLLEALERGVQHLAGDLVAQLLQRALERVAAGVLAEHERVGLEPDGRRVHDLVGRALLEHAVLVDAGLVGERVAADDRLVRLHRVAGEARDQAARARDLARVDAGVQPADVGGARVQQHHDLLERRVARALADPVDRALDLPRARLQAGERVRDREAEVVVAVDGEHDVAQARHQLVEPAQERGVLVRHRVADGVGDVDRASRPRRARSARPRRCTRRRRGSRPSARTRRRRRASARGRRRRGPGP